MLVVLLAGLEVGDRQRADLRDGGAERVVQPHPDDVDAVRERDGACGADADLREIDGDGAVRFGQDRPGCPVASAGRRVGLLAGRLERELDRVAGDVLRAGGAWHLSADRDVDRFGRERRLRLAGERLDAAHGVSSTIWKLNARAACSKTNAPACGWNENAPRGPEKLNDAGVWISFEVSSVASCCCTQSIARLTPLLRVNAAA